MESGWIEENDQKEPTRKLQTDDRPLKNSYITYLSQKPTKKWKENKQTQKRKKKRRIHQNQSER